MWKYLIGVPLLLLAATPAPATGGLVCRTAGAQPAEVSLVIGHTAVASVVSARLRERGRDVPVRVAQSWLEPNELRLDLVDPNTVRHEARIRAKRNGRAFDGTLWRAGKARWVRCREG